MKEDTKIYNFNLKEKTDFPSFESVDILNENKIKIIDETFQIQEEDKQKIRKENSSKRIRLNPKQQKIHQLEKKIKKSELKFEILKNAGENLYLGSKFVFKFIAENEKKYPIRVMCKVLNINRGTYHRWKRNFISPTQERKILIQKEITAIFFKSKQRYGCKRITAVLHSSGYQIAHSTVGRYMRELGLYSVIKKVKVIYKSGDKILKSKRKLIVEKSKP
jgi:hypothetical protein